MYGLRSEHWPQVLLQRFSSLENTIDGETPGISSNGLQPTSDGLHLIAIASNLLAMACTYYLWGTQAARNCRLSSFLQKAFPRTLPPGVLHPMGHIIYHQLL